MNAHAKPKAAKADTVAGELQTMDNLRIWTALGKTDPAHTKQFSRAGGFKGTAIKPIWITQRLTELFGPCGDGWGFEKPEFQLVNGDNRELLVFCTVTGWYVEDGKRRDVHGVGGDKVITYIKANAQYSRAERWDNDDEAFKKAFTDALGNAFKFVGVGADVHMGLFDDSKYVAEVSAEFHPKPEPEAERKNVKLDGPYDTIAKLERAAKEFTRTLRGMGSLQEFDDWAADKDVQAFVDQCKRDLPDWWNGGPSVPKEMVPLGIEVRDTRRGLKQMAEMENQ